MKPQVIKYQVNGKAFWKVDFQLMGVRFRKRGYATKREALLVLSKARKDILMGCFCEDDYKAVKKIDTKVGDYFHSVYWDNKSASLKASTAHVRRNIWTARILPYWGKKKISDITQTEVSKFLGIVHRDYGCSPVYQYNLLTYLLLLVKSAVKDGTLPVMPQIDKPRYTLKKGTFFTRNEMKKILNTGKGSRGNDLIHLLFYLALRFGEAVALRVEDVDMEGGTIRINKRVYRGVVDTIKNEKTAVLEIHPDLKNVIERLVSDAPSTGELFPQKGRPGQATKRGVLGKTEASRSVNSIIIEALGEGCPTGTHIFRRTMGNLLVEGGTPLNQVAYLLRDTEATIMKHYSKVNVARASQAVREIKVV